MGTFFAAEKRRQIAFKLSSRHFSEAARADGLFGRSARKFCLPQSHASENLFAGIREDTLRYFQGKRIRWHQGCADGPSNHLCSSQVSCVNFLAPFAFNPVGLKQLLQPILPEIKEMLPVEETRYVAFEWIGLQDYLSEAKRRSSGRTRGANSTSADAAVRFRRLDGSIQTVLVEWKYTESYSSKCLAMSESGTDRKSIYSEFYSKAGGVIDPDRVPEFGSLFYNPFDQLMRQQMLAHEMEQHREGESEIVSVLHVAPRVNAELRRITSPEFLKRNLGSSPFDVWPKLLRNSDRFLSVSAEDLFGPAVGRGVESGREWAGYLAERYSWIGAHATASA